MRFHAWKKIATFFLFCLCILWKETGGAEEVSGVLVPFYVYPTQEAIQPLIAAKNNHPNVPMRVILNPNSGVGTVQDPNYVAAISVLKKANIAVAGYVFTNYNARPIQDVKAEIQRWVTWYRPNGIFLDAMGTNLNYYQELTTFIKSLGLQFSIGNAGANVDTSFAQVVDTVVIANNNSIPPLSTYAHWQSSGLLKTKIGMLFYHIPTYPTAFVNDVKKFVGWLYVTDRVWDGLPSYFEQLMDALDTTRSVGMMFPFYIYPTQAAIQPLLNERAKHPTVPMRVILNPYNGPGATRDANYVRAIAQLKNAGISVLGYVYTSYGNRARSAVNNDIYRWVYWYQPDGIFFDEMGYKPDYYNSITAYAKNLGIKYVVGNPGSNINLDAGNNVDTVNIVEDLRLADLSQYQSWYDTYPPSKISLLNHTIPTLPVDYIKEAAKHFAWIFITDDGADGNPWDEYPTYFSDLMNLLDSL